MRKILLVDCENVGNRRYGHILGDGSLVYYFTTKKVDESQLLGCEILINFQHDGCKDALDFIIDTYLGYLIRQYKYTREYIIVSKDTGFDNVCKFWRDMGYIVMRDYTVFQVIDSSAIQVVQLVSASRVPAAYVVRCRNIYLNFCRMPDREVSKLADLLHHSLHNAGYSLDKCFCLAEELIRNKGSVVAE